LVRWELELENEIIRRKLLLNDAYQKVISLEINIKKIEASDNAQVYIGNIINNHKQLDKYDKYITNNFDFVNNNDNSTNYLGSEINHYQEILPK
jgi:hypothetical protein